MVFKYFRFCFSFSWDFSWAAEPPSAICPHLLQLWPPFPVCVALWDNSFNLTLKNKWQTNVFLACVLPFLSRLSFVTCVVWNTANVSLFRPAEVKRLLLFCLIWLMVMNELHSPGDPVGSVVSTCLFVSASLSCLSYMFLKLCEYKRSSMLLRFLSLSHHLHHYFTLSPSFR